MALLVILYVPSGEAVMSLLFSSATVPGVSPHGLLFVRVEGGEPLLYFILDFRRVSASPLRTASQPASPRCRTASLPFLLRVHASSACFDGRLSGHAVFPSVRVKPSSGDTAPCQCTREPTRAQYSSPLSAPCV